MHIDSFIVSGGAVTITSGDNTSVHNTTNPISISPEYLFFLYVSKTPPFISAFIHSEVLALILSPKKK